MSFPRIVRKGKVVLILKLKNFFKTNHCVLTGLFDWTVHNFNWRKTQDQSHHSVAWRILGNLMLRSMRRHQLELRLSCFCVGSRASRRPFHYQYANYSRIEILRKCSVFVRSSSLRISVRFCEIWWDLRAFSINFRSFWISLKLFLCEEGCFSGESFIFIIVYWIKNFRASDKKVIKVE